MTIFDYPHIFVVFPQGSGGNFITGLLDKIDSKNFSNLYVSNSGSSHVINNGKIDGYDSVSLGSNVEENAIFSNIEAREEYYLDKIFKEYNNPKKVITWTHDFTNLPLYKKHFKNSKSLVIATYTVEEKLISTLMHVNKVILSDESDIPISKDLWLKLKTRLKFHIASRLENMVGNTIDIDYIFNNRNNQYRDLIFYLSSIILLNYSGLHDVLKLIGEPIVDTKFKNNANIRELILQNSDVILPYSYLINNNFALLENSISKIFNRPLDNTEKDFIKTTLCDYRSKQPIELLTDPLLYFNSYKTKAIASLNQLKEMHNEH